jgi:hypothetical protein
VKQSGLNYDEVIKCAWNRMVESLKGRRAGHGSARGNAAIE